jgi:hypothetical protein
VGYLANFFLIIKNTLTISVKNINTQVSGHDFGVTAEFRATVDNSQDIVLSNVQLACKGAD